MRYVSGLIIIGFAVFLIKLTLDESTGVQAIFMGLSALLALTGAFTLLPSSFASPAEGRAKHWRQLWTVAIGVHVICGLFFLRAGINVLMSPKDYRIGLAFLVSALPFLGGALHLGMIYRREGLPKPSQEELETRLMQIAARHDGECTLEALVAQSGIKRERAEQLLSSLSQQAKVGVYVDGQGQTFYRFHQLFEAHKARRDILDEEPVLFDHDGESQQQHTIKQPAAHTSKR